MPKKLHDKLEKEADKKGLKDDAKDRYIYSVLRRTGWVPKK